LLTLSEAAKETGLSRTAIFKAIQSGRLSASKNDNGHFLIDPAELFRVYKPVNKQVNIESVLTSEQRVTAETTELLTKILERERAQLLAQIEDLKTDRDHWRKQATMLLTHQPEHKPEPEQHKSRLLEKLFGRGS
jgi:hypothetical protein